MPLYLIFLWLIIFCLNMQTQYWYPFQCIKFRACFPDSFMQTWVFQTLKQLPSDMTHTKCICQQSFQYTQQSSHLKTYVQPWSIIFMHGFQNIVRYQHYTRNGRNEMKEWALKVTYHSDKKVRRKETLRKIPPPKKKIHLKGKLDFMLEGAVIPFQSPDDRHASA